MIFSKLNELCNPQTSSCHLHLISALTTSPRQPSSCFCKFALFWTCQICGIICGLLHQASITMFFAVYSCCVMHQHFVSAFIALIVSIVWIYHILLIHLPVGGLLDSFHLTLMNNATIQVFVWMYVLFLLGKSLSVALLNHTVNLNLTF